MAAQNRRVSVTRETVTIAAAYDPRTKRYRATCPKCGYIVIRSTSESALWNLAQHVPHTHGAEVNR